MVWEARVCVLLTHTSSEGGRGGVHVIVSVCVFTELLRIS